jgi:hypothetical protein
MPKRNAEPTVRLAPLLRLAVLFAVGVVFVAAGVRAALAASASRAPHLDVKKFEKGAASLRATVVCGLHPRERVATALCTRWAAQLQRRYHSMPRALNLTLITIVHRDSALADECRRGNWRGVDLNRDWPAPHSCGYVPEGRISQAETRALYEVLYSNVPDILLSVHSGTLAALVPYDCGSAAKPANYADQLRFAHWLTDSRVPIGQAEQILSYRAYGTLSDFAHSHLGVPLVTALEIYEFAGDERALPLGDECRPEWFSPATANELEAVLASWDSALDKLLTLADSDDAHTLRQMCTRKV